MTDIEKLLNHKGIFQSAYISPRSIVFSDEVRKMCEMNSCGRYGKCWSCPPGVGNVEDLRNEINTYNNAFVFTHMGKIEDSFDFECMTAIGDESKQVLRDIMKNLNDAGVKYKALGCGSCSICEKCTYPENSCRFPDKAIASVEAVGIDVTQLASFCGINYHNGEKTVTYFNMILY